MSKETTRHVVFVVCFVQLHTYSIPKVANNVQTEVFNFVQGNGVLHLVAISPGRESESQERIWQTRLFEHNSTRSRNDILCVKQQVEVCTLKLV